MKKRVTQAQIAELSGVCQSTVSLVLSGKQNAAVQPETYERVFQAARELGYHKIGSKLSGEQTGYIGFFVSESCHKDDRKEYIRRFYNGVLEELGNERFRLIQTVIRDDEEIPELVRQGKVDGVIIEDSCDEEMVRRTASLVPVVLVNYENPFLDIDSCAPNNVGGMWQAMKHLYDLGHRRIALFSASHLSYNHAERLQGYRSSLAAFGLPVREEDIALCDFDWAADWDAAEQASLNIFDRLFDQPDPPTAVMSLCDFDATFLLRAARLRNIEVPAHLSVVGFDNSALYKQMVPRLTTIHQPMEAMGRQACRMLLARIDGCDQPAAHTRLALSLIVQESTAAPAIVASR
ncbi:MAG TPA: LacI family DNA-binding transcriptional regulator [Armatimonadota bacterium]|nr:LacI family DNA-binding transcriptional regulator [Armatimonadota bacterium]